MQILVNIVVANVFNARDCNTKKLRKGRKKKNEVFIARTKQMPVQ